MSSSFDRYILKASGPSSNILETGYCWDPESLNLRPWKLLGPTKSLPCLLKPYENTFFGKRIKMIFASPEPEESTSEAIHLEKSTALQKTDNHPLKSQLLWQKVKGQCDFSDLTVLEKGTETRARWQCSAPAVRTWTHVLLSEATSPSADGKNRLGE